MRTVTIKIQKSSGRFTAWIDDAELGWDGQVRGGGEPPAVFADPCDAASFAEAHEWDVDYADWPVAEIVAETAGCPARVEAARGK